MYLFSPKLPFHPDFHITLSRVPCAVHDTESCDSNRILYLKMWFLSWKCFLKLLIISLLAKKKKKKKHIYNHINLIARMRSSCSPFIWKLFWDNHSYLAPSFMLFSFSFSLTSKVSWTLVINHTVKSKVYHDVALFFFFFLKMSSIFSPYYLLGAFISTIRQVQW